MAINVPYKPVPDEVPGRAPIPEVRPSVVEEAFGGSVAKAIGGIGSNVEHLGDQLFQRAIALQDLENQRMATDADNEFTRQSAQIHAKFNSLEGVNAGPKALEKYANDLSALRTQIGAELPNPVASKLYDRSTKGQLARHVFNGAGHAAAQTKKAGSDSLTAAVDLSMQDFANDPNPETFNVRFQKVAGRMRALGDLHGWDSAKTIDETAKILSRARIEQIRGLAQRSPFEAEKLYEEHKGQIHWTQQDSVSNLVNGGTTNVKARFIDERSEVNGDLKSGEPDEKRGVEERVKAAREIATKESKDPLLADYAGQRARATYNQFRQDQKDNVQRNDQTMLGGINGYTNEGGRIFSNRDDLYAFGTPEQIRIYDAAKPSERKKYDTWMAKNAKGDVQLTPERREKYEQLLGLSTSDPSEFMSKDIMSEDLPKDLRNKLWTRRDAVIKHHPVDPRIGRAMETMMPTLNALGYVPTGDKEKYLRFRGAMESQMAIIEGEQKKPMTLDEIKILGSQLLQNIKDPRWYDVFNTSTTPMAVIDVPDSDIKRIVNSPRWNGRVPSDAEIQAAYVRELYINKYGAMKPGDKPVGTGHQ